MKICALSPLTYTNPKEILQFIKHSNHDFIILPGYHDNHPDHKKIAKVLKTGMFVFVETKSINNKLIPRLISTTENIKMPYQVFTTSPNINNVNKLQNIWSKRTHEIGNRQFSFAICSEIDAFKKDGTVKYECSLPFDVLVNPTHAVRGRWNHLGVKLETLSQGKVVIHVANNDKNNPDLITNVRIYVDGAIMDRHNSGYIVWSECEI